MTILKLDTKMERYALTPKKIVEKRLTFSIPLYQRLFAWSEDQINPLLLDLLYNSITNRNKHYYIGLLTVKDSDLVDGQQRFTVMTLMALVMKKITPSGTSTKWKDFLKEGDSLRLSFTARKNDEDFLNNLINKEDCVSYIRNLFDNDSQTDEYYNEKMAKGLLVIADFMDNIKEHVTTTLELSEDKVPTLDSFCDYVYEHLAFFTQEMPSGYTPRMMNKYFESMNSTGRNLENHEILKVHLLKDAFPNDNNSEEYNCYVTMWNKSSQMEKLIFGASDDNLQKYKSSIKDKSYTSQSSITKDSSLSISEVLSGAEIGNYFDYDKRESRFHSFLNFTDFLLQVLWIELRDKELAEKDKIVTNRFFKRENLGKTFETYWDYIDRKQFIADVFKYRIILDWSIIRVDGEGDYELLAKSDAEYSMLEQYEAMMYASSSQYTYHHWIPAVLKTVEGEGWNESELLKKLKSLDNSLHKMPDEQQLFFPQVDTYYFRRLDYYIWEKVVSSEDSLKEVLLNNDADFQPGVIESIKSYKFHLYNSKEHLYPRNEKMQLEFAKWSQTDLDYDYEKALNGFGNLALISGSFNSTQKHQSLNHKFVNVAEQILNKKIESIKLALMYCCARTELKNWTKPSAEEHKNKMIEILKDSYL